jgi:transcriptional regulator with XRE-family HTH domain
MPNIHPPAQLANQLRQARHRARLSQLELSLRLGVSQRHISFVEGSRAKPSRELLTSWLQELDVPLAERNQALLAAGFAPIFAQSNWQDPALASAQQALQQLLSAHDPSPAFVIDAQWNVLQLNRGARWLAGALMPELVLGDSAFNLLDALVAPNGMGNALSNLTEVGPALLARLRCEAQSEPALIPRVAAFAAMLQLHSAGSSRPAAENGTLPPLLNSRYRTKFGDLAFFSMFTTFGTPHDISLASLRVEHLFAADDATKAVLHANVA